MDVLGCVPVFSEIRETGDRGMPVTLAMPDHPASGAFMELARRVVAAMPNQ
jgi:hypothetical protein